jgi:hypothetical protein
MYSKHSTTGIHKSGDQSSRHLAASIQKHRHDWYVADTSCPITGHFDMATTRGGVTF